MNIKDFVKQYKNYPILFWGTGMSLRYLENSYTWENLLKKISCEIFNEEYFLELKGKYFENGFCDYSKVSQEIEKDFDAYCVKDRDGKFKEINDKYFAYLREGKKISRLKIYVASIFKEINIKQDTIVEIENLKKAIKNIGSVITTNYDTLVEELFGFVPLVGNDILLSNPYGAVYKIHGSESFPEKIILTEDDYKSFANKYDLIRAQLLSLFIHHPIIFVGYSVADNNIKELLKTIFDYVGINSEQATQVRNNFLLVEYEEKSNNEMVVEHDIELTSGTRIRINRLKTDNFTSLYNAIEQLSLPISVMDIRKVQNIVKEIVEGGDIKVSITDNLEDLPNSEKILAIGRKENIYIYKNTNDMMIEYFDIIEDNLSGIIKSIEKQSIGSTQFFPAYGFSKICTDVARLAVLKKQQKKKLEDTFKQYVAKAADNVSTIDEIRIQSSNSKLNTDIAYYTYKGNIALDEVKDYLLKFKDKKSTDYRRLITVYDYKKYN